MTTSEKFSHAQFSLFVMFLFGLTLLVVVLFFGCRQKPVDQQNKPAVTIENLRVAYGKSIMRQGLYTRFAERAKGERYANTARLFRAAARSEEIHAALHTELLRKLGVEPPMAGKDSVAIGTPLQMLKMSISNEQLEAEGMYPNLIRTAGVENFPEAVEQFKKVKEADARHLELFRDAYDFNGRIKKVPYLVCLSCGYILTSEKTEECPVCHTGEEKFETL